ncbi:MAG: class I SAM-dependent methyltransferase [Candidatus Peregrinibacteria bacterium]|nr:class I SAM-dependent methyltransferase [Candidatus Peregrinibacteria bacterium]
MRNAIVAKYWDKQFARMEGDNGYWTNNVIVAEHINTLMTGENTRWLPWLFHSYFGERTFRSALSVCCGNGSQELDMYNTGCVEQIHGFDLSPGAIQSARERFSTAGIHDAAFRFQVEDAREFSAPDHSYDLILCAGALHHLRDLESTLANMHSLLSDDGFFVLVEYVGPNYHQWTPLQLSATNSILERIDPLLLRNHQREFLKRPSRTRMLLSDPSESPRSQEIPHLVRNSFRVVYERAYNGTLIHPLHPLLNADLVNVDDEDFDALVRSVISLEADLIQQGVLSSDFIFMVCRKSPQSRHSM